jgi:hypothetical protein
MLLRQKAISAREKISVSGWLAGKTCRSAKSN